MEATSLNRTGGEPSVLRAAQFTQVTADSAEPMAPPTTKKGRGLLWGVGGTVLSVLGFVGMLLFEQYNGMLAELRNDLKHFNETSSEYVKKDVLLKLREHMKDCYKEMQACTLARTQLENELRGSEKARSDMAAEMQRMRERLAFLEGRQAATPTSVPTESGPSAEPPRRN
jgi:hypothetical protein